MPINTFTIREWAPDGIEVDLIELTLAKDGLGYYLSPRYRVETSRDIKEIYIPKARLRIDGHQIMVEHDSRINNYITDLGFGKMNLYADDKGHVYYETIVEEKTKEMTLEEIEEQLGHKVKIITKEN